MASSKSKYLWTTAALVFAAALMAAWKIGNSPTPIDPFKPGTPIHTVELPDGSKLEIYGTGIGEWIDGSMAPPPSTSFSIYSTGTSGTSWGDSKHFLSVDTRTIDEKTTGITLAVPKKDLLLSMRFHSPAGQPISPEKIDPELLTVELSDNTGNWLKGYGPLGSEDDPFRRGIIGFAGWPRTGGELLFRASVAGSDAIEFRLPNPNFGRKAEAWAASSLPHTVSTPDWDFTLTEVREKFIPGMGYFLIPTYTFTDRISEPSQSHPFIEFQTENVLGSRGTESNIHVLEDSGRGIEFSYAMPPDEDLFKFNYAVRREKNYPYTAADFTVIAKARVSADGKSIDHIHTNPGFGITSITFGKVEPAHSAFYPGSQSFAIALERKYSGAGERQRITRQFGDWNDVRAAAFTPGKPTIFGTINANSWGSSHSSDSGDFSWGAIWYGELMPGQELDIGIANALPDESIAIVVARKDIKPAAEN